MALHRWVRSPELLKAAVGGCLPCACPPITWVLRFAGTAPRVSPAAAAAPSARHASLLSLPDGCGKQENDGSEESEGNFTELLAESLNKGKLKPQKSSKKLICNCLRLRRWHLSTKKRQISATRAWKHVKKQEDEQKLLCKLRKGCLKCGR